jgi:hypothetical protein
MFRGRKNDQRSASSPAEHLSRAQDAWPRLATETKRGAFLDILGNLIEDAQRAAAGSATGAYAILAAGFLVAARASHAGTIPSDVEARCVGFATAALARSARARGDEPPSALEAVVQERFKILRGRIRGSVFVPRDVEYAFAGSIQGLEPMALSPDKAPALRKLLDEGVTKVLVDRGVAARAGSRENTVKLAAALQKAARANELAVEWDTEDVEFMRAVAEAQQTRTNG